MERCRKALRKPRRNLSKFTKEAQIFGSKEFFYSYDDICDDIHDDYMSTVPDFMPHREGLRTIMRDVFDIRESKLRASIDVFIKGEGTYTKLDKFSLLEIHSVRPMLPLKFS
uniref:Uncharacterized protein n=1 Tax=Glossina pallidipes TaxID=7398 RepID=A0A1A9ZAN5_GLOPL